MEYIHILEERIYERLFAKIRLRARTIAPSNEHYFSVYRNLPETFLQSAVSCWHCLNIDSFCARHGRKYRSVLPPFLEPTVLLDDYQLVKWLRYLRENIDLDAVSKKRTITTEERLSIGLLTVLIVDIMSTIIEGLPAYIDAPWGTF